MQFRLITLALLLFSQSLFGQSLDLQGVWHDPELPIRGGVRYNEVWGFTDCEGDEYGIIGSLERIHFVDMRNPNNPTEIKNFIGGGNSYWRDIKTYKNRAYAVTEDSSEGMMVFDLSELPNDVTRTNQTRSSFGSAHNIFVDEPNSRLYVVGANTRNNGIIIYDLSTDMDDPEVIADISLPGGYVHDVFVRDNIAYCSHGNNGLYVYDFTIADSPILLGSINSYPEKGYNHSSWLSPDGNFLVFADETHDRGLKMMDVSDKTDLTITDVFRSELEAPTFTGSIAHNPFIRDGLIFVSYYHDGIQVFDYSDPSNVQQIAGYDTDPSTTVYDGFDGSWGTYPYFNSGLVLGSDVNNGLFAFKMNGYDFEPIDYGSKPSLTISNSSTDLFLCNNESITLSATSDDATAVFEWYKNGDYLLSSNSLLVSESGDYQAKIENGRCSAISETFAIVRKPNSSTNIQGYNEICPNESLTFTVAEGADNYSFYNEEGELIQSGTSNSITLSTDGDYYAMIDLDGCSARTNTLTVKNVFPQYTASITLIDGKLQASEAATYTWFLDGATLNNGSQRTQVVISAGLYEVETVDNVSGCVTRSTAFRVGAGELNTDLGLNNTQLYYSPESNTFNAQFIATTNKDVEVHVYDIIGRLIWAEKVNVKGLFVKKWDVSHLANGIYTFGIIESKERLFKKVILARE